MDFKQIERRVITALELLRIKDFYLLKCDVNERALTHKLAEHLQYVIGNSLDIDCEYNRNIDELSNCKKIQILKSDLANINRDENKNGSLTSVFEEQYQEVSVFPDIIVHKRGTNLKNILAIEVKKSTSRISYKYDHLKLKCYTDISEANKLKYDYGAFIKLHTGEPKYITPEIIWFKNGEKLYEKE
ncbi:hypothetical protein [Desnuesiella massiliensis]|uniref:hypothetical protein n=1 Tax=Desnuesiella massiliensis TaxID=1650662 RepID=UPI0006E1FB16|nr:hypothetical protein [Desnuesiella massiliensis]